MKEIKKEVKKEIIETITIYQAADGSEFNNAEECKKYENSAAGMLMCKVSDFSLGEISNTMDENDDNIYKLVIPTTQEQIDTLNHLHKLFGGRTLDTLLSQFPTKEFDTSDEYTWDVVGSSRQNIPLVEARDEFGNVVTAASSNVGAGTAPFTLVFGKDWFADGRHFAVITW